jgi:hypothetical protein
MNPARERAGLRSILYVVAVGAAIIWAVSLFNLNATAYDRALILGFVVLPVVGLACSVPGRR